MADYIDRQAAIDIVVFECGKWTGLAKEISKQLKQLPPAQPEPQEGKWVYGEDSTADCVDGYRCSQCGFFVPWDYNHKFIDYINDYAYCPNCGARMKGAAT